MSVSPVCVYAHCRPVVLRSQVRVLELLGLECQKTVRGRGGAGNPAGALCRSSCALDCWAISPVPMCCFDVNGFDVQDVFPRSYVMVSSGHELRIVRAYVYSSARSCVLTSGLF